MGNWLLILMLHGMTNSSHSNLVVQSKAECSRIGEIGVNEMNIVLHPDSALFRAELRTAKYKCVKINE